MRVQKVRPNRLSLLRPTPVLAWLLLGTVMFPGCRLHVATLALIPLETDGLVVFAPGKPGVSGNPGVPDSARVRLALDQQSVTLAGAINETMSFHFAVVSGDEPVTLEAIEMSPFQSSSGAVIHPGSLRLFRLHAVAVPGYPGWHLRSTPPKRRRTESLDVLVPLDAPQGGLPVRLGPDEAAHFWVDVHVPKGTVAGTYATDLHVKSRGRVMATMPIRLTVQPFVLPDDSDIPFIAELDHRNLSDRMGGRKEQRDETLIATLRMLQAHRLSPTLPSLSPAVRLGTDGEAIVDWTRYDAIVSPCLDGGLPGNGVSVRYWPWPLGPAREAFLRSPESPSPSTLKLILGYLRACEEHFASKGWLDRSYALWSATGDRRATVDSTLRFSAMLRRAAGRVPIASQLCPQDLAPYGWVDFEATDFKDLIDIWAPPAQFFDPQVMNTQRAAGTSPTGGHRTWITVDRPPFSGSITVHAAPADIRVLSWQAMQLGAEAVLLGTVNHWPSRIADPDACIQFDPSVLLYPGAPFGLSVPVASIRLKMLRASQQDAAYRRLLRDWGLEHIGRVLGHSLAPYSGMQACRTHFADGRRPGWPGAWSLFDAAREIMAAPLARSDQADRPPGDTLSFQATIRWRAFMAATRTVRLRADGARLDLLETSPSVTMRLTCSVSVWNGRRTALNARAKLNPPQGWTWTAEPSRDLSIPPNSFGRTTLTARITTPPATGCGFLTLPIILEEPDGTSHEVSARVALVTALPFRGKLSIDGDLSDWPPGTTNVATDFRLITGEVFDAAGEDAGRPRRATMAFFLRDEKFLYVAINCTFDRQSFGSNANRKSVTYDDLIPVGQEMIELLLDPLNSGTRTPSDLYHIVVKAAGTDLAEIGIRTDPPVSRRRGWLVDLEVATRSYPHRWTVELRIPLDAFSVPNVNRTVWGLNITRVDQANQEFSTWSGAVGNAYDPLSLGNLYLP